MNRIKLFSIDLCTGLYEEFVQKILFNANKNNSGYACLANVHMLIEAKKNKSFKNVVGNANMVLPDGKPLGWALKLLYGIKQERVAGMDLLPDLIAHAANEKMPVFFYGGTKANLEETKKFLHNNYPALPLAGFCSPPFRQLKDYEEERIVELINSSGAQLVFVALGCPKQETWMANMKGRVNAYMVGVGGALPVFIGKQKRAPAWMQRSGLEWFYRLSQEPVRLFKRYAITNSAFLYLLTKKYLQLKVFKKRYKYYLK